MLTRTIKHSLLAVAVASLLSACGSDNDDNNFSPRTVSGTAVDFYLANATVTFDDCNNSNNGNSVTTNAQGQFSFNTTAACNNSAITITGGTDTATGLPFTGTLKLKKTDLQNTASNKVVVSPLTSLDYYLTQANRANQLSTILTNLRIDTSLVNANNISSFDPVADGDAQTAAASFILQQLVTHIEDSLEAINTPDGESAISTEDATRIAFESILEHINDQPMFASQSVQINANLLTAILETAVDKAQDEITNPDVEIDTGIIDHIHTNITAVSEILNNVVQNADSGEALLDAIQSPVVQDQLQENLLLPQHNTFSLAGYNIDQLRASRADNPLNINLSNFENVLSTNFKLDNLKSSEATDTFRLGIQLLGQSGNRTESLYAILNNVQITFDQNGNIDSVYVPAGSSFAIRSSLAGVDVADVTLNNEISLDSNGEISLIDLVRNHPGINNYYNRYREKLSTGDTVQTILYVLPSTYALNPSYSMASGEITVGEQNFKGAAVIGYFRLN
ncbi:MULTISPECIES: hypothetical protein [Acinetobacter]|uniref:hypothetical protein n=1 Tax=Acinetobacter TaxID=469 RepID=UPI002246A416|nr:MULTISPECIES: hypothetical protein [Acinetobacter]MCX0339717.1 hypothetical protein [Acinetobacter radioresistens]